MDWFYEITPNCVENDIEEEVESLTINYVAQCHEKMLCVDVFYETENQAILEATIIGVDNEEEKPELEYFYRRVFVGFKDELFEKIKKVIKYKISELEKIVKGKDLEKISKI